MPEKLLTIREVADYLRISEEEVKRLVDVGEIPAYKIGGTFLRFRKEQIDAVKAEDSALEKETHLARPATPPAIEPKEKAAHPYTELERDIKHKEPITRAYDYTPVEKMKDFFYFNDFYVVSFVIIAVLLFLIFRG